MRYLCVVALLVGTAGCKREPAKPGIEPGSRASAAGPHSGNIAGAASSGAPAAALAAGGDPCAALPVEPAAISAPPRLVAIGDLHGDIAAMREVLALAGAIDDRDRWAGGDLVIVQTGDILDRGDDEQAMLDWFERLREQAAAAGGAVHVLNGNHELMNAAGDLRYVTPGGFRDFADVDPGDAAALPALANLEAARRPRAAAFMPGGVYARVLAGYNVAVVVGDSVFVHGGILPGYAEYGLDRLNREVRCWLHGTGPAPAMLDDPASPVWSRAYSMAPEACDELAEALALLGAKRMVVGHTTQPGGITSACDDRVWRIDVGLAAFYGGPRQALEIRGDEVRILRSLTRP